MFRPYVWAIFRLRFNLQISYTRCVHKQLQNNQLEKNPLATALGHGIETTRSRSPTPNPQYPKRTPHTSCIADL